MKNFKGHGRSWQEGIGTILISITNEPLRLAIRQRPPLKTQNHHPPPPFPLLTEGPAPSGPLPVPKQQTANSKQQTVPRILLLQKERGSENRRGDLPAALDVPPKAPYRPSYSPPFGGPSSVWAVSHPQTANQNPQNHPLNSPFSKRSAGRRIAVETCPPPWTSRPRLLVFLSCRCSRDLRVAESPPSEGPAPSGPFPIPQQKAENSKQ